MSQIILKAQSRNELGRKIKPLRKEGFLPAVLYGEKVSSMPISVKTIDFARVLQSAGESTLIKLEVGEEQHNVLIHDVSRDPLKGNFLHADFYAVRMDRAIRSEVPLVFMGEAPVVKAEGGILVRVKQEIEIEALPQNLPKELAVDLAALGSLGSKILVSDIKAPEGVKILAEPEEVVVLVEAPRTEEELIALEQAPEEKIEEIKTEREVKEEAKGKEESEEDKEEKETK